MATSTNCMWKTLRVLLLLSIRSILCFEQKRCRSFFNGRGRSPPFTVHRSPFSIHRSPRLTFPDKIYILKVDYIYIKKREEQAPPLLIDTWS